MLSGRASHQPYPQPLLPPPPKFVRASRLRTPAMPFCMTQTCNYLWCVVKGVQMSLSIRTYDALNARWKARLVECPPTVLACIMLASVVLGWDKEPTCCICHHDVPQACPLLDRWWNCSSLWLLLSIWHLHPAAQTVPISCPWHRPASCTCTCTALIESQPGLRWCGHEQSALPLWHILYAFPGCSPDTSQKWC